MTAKIVQKIHKNVGNGGNVVWFVFIYIKNFFSAFLLQAFFLFFPRVYIHTAKQANTAK